MTAPRSVVSGGGGFVGRFVVEALLAAGHTVTVTGRTPPSRGFFSVPVSFVPATLEPGRMPPDLFAGARFFVHAAFDHLPGRYRGGEGDDPAGFRRRNLEGSRALFAAARAAGVARTVFLSSRAVYGPHPAGTALGEETPCAPDTLYGTVKLAAERALSDMAGDGHVTVSLRATGVYGPAGPGRAHKWAGLFADFLDGRPIAPRVGTEVHGRDVGAAVRLVLAAEAAAVSGRAFNVSDILLDRRDLLALVADATGCTHPLPAAADAGAVNVMRTGRLAALGWRPGGRDLLARTVGALLRADFKS